MNEELQILTESAGITFKFISQVLSTFLGNKIEIHYSKVEVLHTQYI